jgi:hypothetical protein
VRKINTEPGRKKNKNEERKKKTSRSKKKRRKKVCGGVEVRIKKVWRCRWKQAGGGGLQSITVAVPPVFTSLGHCRSTSTTISASIHTGISSFPRRLPGKG